MLYESDKKKWEPRELDIKIGKELFGLDVQVDEDGPWLPVTFPDGVEDYEELPKYSEDILAAMEVVEVLGVEWGFGAWHYALLSSSGFGWLVAFSHNVRPPSIELVGMGDPEKVKWAHSNRLPEAICLAAMEVLDCNTGGVYAP